jgi:hypothetical protein
VDKILKTQIILKALAHYFEKKVQEDVEHLTKHNCVIYHCSKNVCRNFLYRLSDKIESAQQKDKLCDDALESVAYMLSKYPERDIFRMAVLPNQQTFIRDEWMLLRTGEPGKFFFKILQRSDQYLNSEYNFNEMVKHLDEKRHSSAECICFLGLFCLLGLLCLSAGIGVVINGWLNSSNICYVIYHQWFLPAAGLTLMLIGICGLFCKEFPSMKTQMMMFQRTCEAFEENTESIVSATHKISY